MLLNVLPSKKQKFQKHVFNPWKWQDKLRIAQAVEVSNVTSTLYCSGQAAIDDKGTPCAESMEKQIKCCFDNLDTVLTMAGYTLENVVRLNFYTTSIDDFFLAYEKVINRLINIDCTPASTITEVTSLAFPGLKVEIEATAVK